MNSVTDFCSVERKNNGHGWRPRRERLISICQNIWAGSTEASRRFSADCWRAAESISVAKQQIGATTLSRCQRTGSVSAACETDEQQKLFGGLKVAADWGDFSQWTRSRTCRRLKLCALPADGTLPVAPFLPVASLQPLPRGGRWNTSMIRNGKVRIWICSRGGTSTAFTRTYSNGKSKSFLTPLKSQLLLLNICQRFFFECVSKGLAASETHKRMGNISFCLLSEDQMRKQNSCSSFTLELWLCCRDVILLMLRAATQCTCS